ncbi:MAG: hypothetical protein JNL01_16255 [Bdellovibrionales bacterium]|nr:hypothetical protein [Bdellovibrionales bacterium]
MKTLLISCVALSTLGLSSAAFGQMTLPACQEAQKTKFLKDVQDRVQKECSYAHEVSGYVAASFGELHGHFQQTYGTPVVAPSFQQEGSAIRTCQSDPAFAATEANKRMAAASSVFLNYCQKNMNAKKPKELKAKEVLKAVSSKKLVCTFEKADELKKFMSLASPANIKKRRAEIKAKQKANPNLNPKSAYDEVNRVEKQYQALNKWSKTYCNKAVK